MLVFAPSVVEDVLDTAVQSESEVLTFVQNSCNI